MTRPGEAACDECTAVMDGTLHGLAQRFGRDAAGRTELERRNAERDAEIMKIIDDNARPKVVEKTPISMPPLKSLGEK